MAATAIGGTAVVILNAFIVPANAPSNSASSSFQWFCFVCFVSCGTENNLHWLWQLIDSAGASEYETGTEKHIWKVCGLEVSRKGVPPPQAARKHGSSHIRRWFYLLSTQSTFHSTFPTLSCQYPAKRLWCIVRKTFREIRTVLRLPAHLQQGTGGQPRGELSSQALRLSPLRSHICLPGLSCLRVSEPGWGITPARSTQWGCFSFLFPWLPWGGRQVSKNRLWKAIEMF